MEKSSGDAGAGECEGFVLPSLWRSMKSYVSKNGEAFAYYSAWRTTAEMLEDRNYEIDPDSFNITYTQFLSKFNLTRSDKPRQPDLDALAILATHKCKAAEKAVVAFRETGEIDNEAMRGMYNSLGKPSRIVIVLYGEPAYFQRLGIFISRPEDPVQIEFFHIAELFVNMLRDHLDAEFKLTTTQEQEHVFKEHLKITKLPRIDWIARYFALQKGEMVKGTFTFNPDAFIDVEDESESDERKDDYETCEIRTISNVGNVSYYRLA